MISALNKLADKTIELTLTIPWTRVKKSYQKTLEEAAKEIEIKGFRKGKAPISVVEQKIDKKALYEQTLKNILPEVYTEAVKEHKVRPIINPEVQILGMKEGKAWQIKAVTCEAPEIKLGNYKGEIKKALASEKIWTPDKAQKPEEKISQEDKTAKVFKTLLETIKLTLPKVLVEQEVSRMLSRLIEQTNQLGLTIEQYLASVKKTSDQIRGEYQKQAKETLKLEFILTKIAEVEKITVEESEIDKMVAAVGDEKTKKAFESPQQRVYIRQILQKRKVIDNLLKL